MSMRDYAVDDYGLVINEKYGRQIAQKLDESCPADGNDWIYILYDNGICDYISDFTGETYVLKENGYLDWSKCEYYNADVICYINVSNYPTLFEKAYNNIDEVVEEMKGKIGNYLPIDFDYKNNICKIAGTYFG